VIYYSQVSNSAIVGTLAFDGWTVAVWCSKEGGSSVGCPHAQAPLYSIKCNIMLFEGQCINCHIAVIILCCGHSLFTDMNSSWWHEWGIALSGSLSFMNWPNSFPSQILYNLFFIFLVSILCYGIFSVQWCIWFRCVWFMFLLYQPEWFSGMNVSQMIVFIIRWIINA